MKRSLESSCSHEEPGLKKRCCEDYSKAFLELSEEELLSKFDGIIPTLKKIHRGEVRLASYIV